MKTRPGPKPTSASAVAAWRKHRKELGTRQRELAVALGVTAPAVSKWRFVPAGRVDAVAKFLRLSPGDLRPDLYPADPWSAL